MNGVYNDSVIAAEQIWLKNRLDLIAAAENLTYFLPYFRDRFNYFPKYIYYTATDKDVKDYRQKYALDERVLEFKFSREMPPGKVEGPVQETVSKEDVQKMKTSLLEAMETKLSELQKTHEEELRKMMAVLMERLPVPSANTTAAAASP